MGPETNPVCWSKATEDSNPSDSRSYALKSLKSCNLELYPEAKRKTVQLTKQQDPTSKTWHPMTALAVFWTSCNFNGKLATLCRLHYNPIIQWLEHGWLSEVQEKVQLLQQMHLLATAATSLLSRSWESKWTSNLYTNLTHLGWTGA